MFQWLKAQVAIRQNCRVTWEDNDDDSSVYFALVPIVRCFRPTSPAFTFQTTATQTTHSQMVNLCFKLLFSGSLDLSFFKHQLFHSFHWHSLTYFPNGIESSSKRWRKRPRCRGSALDARWETQAKGAPVCTKPLEDGEWTNKHLDLMAVRVDLWHVYTCLVAKLGCNYNIELCSMVDHNVSTVQGGYKPT